MGVSEDENALNTLASYGLNNSAAIGGLPNAQNLTGEINSLGANVDTPIDFSSQNALIGQNAAQGNALFGLAQQLGQQKALSAIEQDKAARQGRTTSDQQSANAQSAIQQVGLLGQQESDQLLKAGLSEQSVAALGKLHVTAQQAQQQALQGEARNAQISGLNDVQLAQQKGQSQVAQAAKTAQFNEQALNRQWEAQQVSFWSKIAGGLLTAAGGVAGFLIGGPAGAVAGSAVGGAVGGAVSNATGNPDAGYRATLNGYNQAQTSDMTIDNSTSDDTGTSSASYTTLPDSLPVV